MAPLAAQLSRAEVVRGASSCAPPVAPGVSWLGVALVFCLTISTLASAFVTSVLFLRPLLRRVDRAVENMDTAALEMEKTALMLQQELPATLQEVRFQWWCRHPAVCGMQGSARGDCAYAALWCPGAMPPRRARAKRVPSFCRSAKPVMNSRSWERPQISWSTRW